jgi:hypothetical protein
MVTSQARWPHPLWILNRAARRAFTRDGGPLSPGATAQTRTAREETTMAETAVRRDTFFVRPNDDRRSDGVVQVRIDSLTLPSGKKVHALDRDIFNKALHDAMKPVKK